MRISDWSSDVCSSDLRVGPIESAAEAAKFAELQEHWRLLYVAMTRAEEALFIGGSLGPREKEPHPDSWYARIAPVFESEPLTAALWRVRREWGYCPPSFHGSTRPPEEKPKISARATVPIGPNT